MIISPLLALLIMLRLKINFLYENFLWGINTAEIKLFLNKYNLELIEDVGREYYQKNYLKPMNRNIVVFEGERTNLSWINK